MVRSKGGAALLLAVSGTAIIFWYTTKFESDMRQVCHLPLELNAVERRLAL